MLAIAAAAGLAVLSAGPALANTTIPINSGNIAAGGTLAGDAEHECDFGGGPFPGQDVWVFVLPDYGQSGDFVSVTAWFDTDGDGDTDVTETIDASSGGLSTGGPDTSKAYIVLPAGWRLLGATAVITGTADDFNLTHTCVGGTSPSPSPTVSPSPSPSSSPSASASTGSSPSGSPSTSESPSPGVSSSDTPSNGPSSGAAVSPPGSGGGGLALTGIALSTYTGIGTLLIAAGVSALLAARRRRSQVDG